MRIRLKIFLLCVIYNSVCYSVEKDIRFVAAEVVKVVNGDTLNVIVANINEKLKVRLYRIYALVRKQRFVNKAKDALNRLVGDRIVTL